MISGWLCVSRGSTVSVSVWFQVCVPFAFSHTGAKRLYSIRNHWRVHSGLDLNYKVATASSLTPSVDLSTYQDCTDCTYLNIFTYCTRYTACLWRERCNETPTCVIINNQCPILYDTCVVCTDDFIVSSIRLCIRLRSARDCAWHTVPKVHTSHCAYPRTAHY